MAVAAMGVAAGGPVHARKAPAVTWQFERTTDPITGASTCVIAALDRAGRSAFSRAGALYPIVENNPVHGLLVGVSSGGRYRIPTGDIVWRVDDRPYRELKAADNPAPEHITNPTPPAASDVAATAINEAVAQAMRFSAGMTATSTVASGDKAQAMLAEMRAGRGLLFRAAAAAPAYGLQGSAMYRVGQITKDGLKPIPLDESFRAGLQACGLHPHTPEG
jgi:hypothetical protein